MRKKRSMRMRLTRESDRQKVLREWPWVDDDLCYGAMIWCNEQSTQASGYTAHVASPSGFALFAAPLHMIGE